MRSDAVIARGALAAFACRRIGDRRLAVDEASTFARAAVAATIAAATTSAVATRFAGFATFAFALSRCAHRARVVVGGTHPVVVARSARVQRRTVVARIAVE